MLPRLWHVTELITTREVDMDWLKLIKENKKKILGIAAAIFTLAAGMGSTLLSPGQREAIIAFLTAVL